MCKFTVSGRANSNIKDLLNHYSYLNNYGSIDSVFGFTEYTPLYGGRVFSKPELTTDDIVYLYSNGIGYRIPLTNMLPSDEDYMNSTKFLERYHRQGNSIILYDLTLAERIRNDFPLYNIESSVIINPKTNEDINKILSIVDTCVIHGSLNNTNFLSNLEQKEKIRLFTNMGCALECKSRICYKHSSYLNKKQEPKGNSCSNIGQSKFTPSFTEFNIDEFKSLGFNLFKVLRPNPNNTGY